MIYDLNEYNLVLDIPTENFLFRKFTSHDTQYMWEFLPDLEKDIKAPDTLIILFGAFENLHEYNHWIEPLNEFKEKYQNPLVVITGRLSPDRRQLTAPKFSYYRVSVFDTISNLHCFEPLRNISELENETKNYKFYWASTKDLYVRRYLLANLIKNNLVSSNLVNYKCLFSEIPGNYLDRRFDVSYMPTIIETCESIANHIPLPPLDDTVEFGLTDKKFYNECYLGVVTETFYADHGNFTAPFFSEKVFQAINYHQMFFYFGPPHSLQYLRDQGYHTFDDIFDLSFDNIEDNGLRLIKSVESLISYLNRPIEEIKRDYNANAEKIRHNKKLLNSQRKDIIIRDLLQKEIDEYRKTNSNIS